MQNTHVAASFKRTLNGLRNTRDLRAEVVSLATDLVANNASGQLIVADSAISTSTVSEEWQRLLQALDPGIRERMRLNIEPNSKRQKLADHIRVDRPNYRYEVLRLLLGASLTPSRSDSLKRLVDGIGSSQTPVREAISALKQAGVVQVSGRALSVEPDEISQELLARVGALPQKLRFRFEQGARIKPPTALLDRALPLLAQTDSVSGWAKIALSGAAVAHAEFPQIDLMGIPRLDLVAQVPRLAKSFDGNLLRQLDDGLELEPNVLAPTPVVVTLIRAETPLFHVPGLSNARCSFPADVFLSLLDMGLREQALQYARALRG